MVSVTAPLHESSSRDIRVIAQALRYYMRVFVFRKPLLNMTLCTQTIHVQDLQDTKNAL